MKSKNKFLFTRRIVPGAIALCGVIPFTNALDSADRAFRSCPPGPSQQFALGLLFASGTGVVFSLMLALVFAVLAILELARRKNSGKVES